MTSGCAYTWPWTLVANSWPKVVLVIVLGESAGSPRSQPVRRLSCEAVMSSAKAGVTVGGPLTTATTTASASKASAASQHRVGGNHRDRSRTRSPTDAPASQERKGSSPRRRWRQPVSQVLDTRRRLLPRRRRSAQVGQDEGPSSQGQVDIEDQPSAPRRRCSFAL